MSGRKFSHPVHAPTLFCWDWVSQIPAMAFALTLKVRPVSLLIVFSTIPRPGEAIHVSSPANSSDSTRWMLTHLRPILPEVQSPEGQRVTFQQKLMWTGVTLLTFLVMSQM